MQSFNLIQAVLPAFLAGGLASSAGSPASSVLFEYGTIISFNDTLQEFQVLRNASLLVEDDRITQIANESTISNVPSGVTVVNATGKIISPGFINTHQHLWQTAFKTLASNTTLVQYFQRYSEFSPAEMNFTPEDTYLGQLAGALELIYEGTTTALDHAHGDFSDEGAYSAVNATLDSGLRCYYAHAVHPIPNGWPFENQTRLFDTWAADPRLNNSSSLVSVGLAYDFFSSAPEANISALWSAVQKHNLSVVTTHYLGGPWSYTNSPELLDSLGWLNDSVPVVFSHGSFATQSDYRALRRNNQYLSTTPESEQHYGHGHPWSHLIQDQAALGVDTHFTYSAGMVNQARLWLQDLRLVEATQTLVDTYKINANNPMSVRQAFHLITRAGGLALRRSDLGVIRQGAKADLVVFDATSPNMLGWWDPIAAIILHSNTGDIQHVLIDGKFAKKDGKLVYPDYAGLQTKFLESARKIQNTYLNINFPSLVNTPWADPNDPDFTEIIEIPDIDTQRGNGTGY